MVEVVGVHITQEHSERVQFDGRITGSHSMYVAEIEYRRPGYAPEIDARIVGRGNTIRDAWAVLTRRMNTELGESAEMPEAL